MPLSPGTSLGPYQIDAPLGAGGMGEVYKATDTRLDRTVAIKVLPEHVASDPDLKQRFEREAKTVAALSHPNICPVFDVGEQDGINFLVMEYLDGQTLAQRLEKGALPLDQALTIAIEIADALDKAHRQGIVHRDLKPANIMLTKAGAKLLDFGLAKLKKPEQAGGLSALPTQPADLTQEGAILGTFQYMAPEQLEGQEADARTDIFAFGAVVYEMVAGRKAFQGKSQASLIAAIMHVDPPSLSSLQVMSPTALDHVVRTCVAKDPDSRWQTAGDIGRQLKWIVDGASQPVAAPQTLGAAPAQLRVWQRPVPLVLVVIALVAITAVAVWSVMRPTPRPVVRTMLTVAPDEPLYLRGPSVNVAISTDGRHVVYLGERDGQRQLYVRALDSLEATPLTGLGNPNNPFFSPDGNWVEFFDGPRRLRRVSIRGGPPVPIAEMNSGSRGASWGADDTIVFATTAPGTGLWRVASGGGSEPELLTTPDPERGELDHWWPEILPGGQAVLFTIMPQGSVENAQIAVLSLESGTYEVVLPGGSHARYVPTGHLVYGVRGTLHAVGFDLDRLVVTTDPVPVVDTVNMKRSGAVNFGVAQNQSLVYVRGKEGTDGGRSLVWVDRNGGEEPLAAQPLAAQPLAAQPSNYGTPRISPDGTRVALGVADDSGTYDIYIYDLARNNLTQLTFTDEFECCPIWMPDGERVLFLSQRGGTEGDLYVKNADGTGDAERLTEGPESKFPQDVTADGTTVVFWSQGDLHTLSLDGEPTTSVLVQTEFVENRPRLSPDGRWIAYHTDETGELEVLVRPFPEIEDGRWEATIDGGYNPLWSPDGRELFFSAVARCGRCRSRPNPASASATQSPCSKAPMLLTKAAKVRASTSLQMATGS